MHDNEFETKENKFKPRIKLNHNIGKSMTPTMVSFRALWRTVSLL